MNKIIIKSTLTIYKSKKEIDKITKIPKNWYFFTHWYIFGIFLLQITQLKLKYGISAFVYYCKQLLIGILISLQ